jgi:aspartyl-tRNA(Asn)/glutamyl-tRNA(Gln) amidotransferase subunit B
MQELTEKQLLGDYCLVLGLEIHLHLNTKKKMFCGCSADIWTKEPNSVTCPVCLGLPGALPVPNYEAIEKTQLLGLALGCELNKHSRFDRKHYFYPDLPKGYQISQYKQPLCIEGKLDLDSSKIAEIERVHLEEDVAKSIHEGENTLVDYNKSGLTLVEIVSKPCFTNTTDAVDYCKKIQQIVRTLGIGDVDMEKGQMRLEANISLRTKKMEEAGELMPYRVEIKNINSFRFMEKAVRSEIIRQKEILDSEGVPIQENRGFKEGKMDTVAQRSKEEAKDYRYFPEPDIPPMEFDDAYITNLKKKIPQLPAQKKQALIQKYGLSGETAHVLIENLGQEYINRLGELVGLGLAGRQVANLLINKPETRVFTDQQFIDYVKSTKETLDTDLLEQHVVKIIQDNSAAVKDYQAGKESAMQFLFGCLMRETKTRIDFKQAKEMFLQHFNK